MPRFTLIIGNKNYSSWSFRPWILLKEKNIEFKEIFLPIAQENSADEIGKYSDAKKVPILIDHEKNLTIWDSLAICQYLDNIFPEQYIFPQDLELKSQCFSIVSEMHSGFMPLRKAFPLNIKRKIITNQYENDLKNDINRVFDIFRNALFISKKSTGGFLFGDFSVADAFFAPVLSRFKTYGVEIPQDVLPYAQNIYNLDSFKQWEIDAHNEDFYIEKFENVFR